MMHDVRHAWRLIVRRPRVSALVVATLAIGMAATTIVFSLADAILWHPLPFRDADRLVRVRVSVASARGAAARPLDVVTPDFGASVFDGLYPFQLNSAIASVGGEPHAVTIGEISPGLLHALGVALVGVYGSFWCVVNQRTREIGVRMALGASASDVLRLVLGSSARVMAAGVAVGLPLALVTARLLKSWLFEVSPSDPPTFLAVVAFLAAAAMLATYLPARRAAAVDPAHALRTP
jgi:hypothetical protein